MTFEPTPTPPRSLDYRDVARVADRLLTPVAVLAADGTMRYANAVAAKLLDAEPTALVGRKMLNFVHPDDRARVARELEAIIRGEPAGGFTRYRVRGEHASSWHVVDCYAHNLLDDADVRGILVSGGEVTEQEQLARALRTVTSCNRMMVHATDEVSLVTDICRSIVETSTYALAWVGFAEADDDRTVRTVAAFGDAGYLEGVRVSWGDNEYGRGPTGTAIRTNTVQIFKDVRRSKRCAPWRPRIEEYGLKTSCALPLNVSGRTIGALSIYSRDAGTFGPAEVELLEELAEDLAYGIGRLRDGELLARNEAHLREAERLAHVGHWEWDPASDRFDFMADEMFDIYGIEPDGWVGDLNAFVELAAPETRPAVRSLVSETLERGTAELLHRVLRSDGGSRFVRLRTEAVADRDGRPRRILGISHDVTAQVTARQELEHSREFLLAITNNMAEGMIATDGNGVITFANAAAGKLLGVDAESLLGRPTVEAFQFRRDEENGDDTESPLSVVWTLSQSLNVEHDTLLRLDGTSVAVGYIGSPLRTDGLSGAVIVFEDVTERAAEQLKVERELEKLTWVGRIRDALDNGRFVLYAQPIIDLATFEVVQNELLLRMVTPKGEVILPDSFLPTAEEYGLISEIDRWVVHETVHFASQGHAVEFNLSAKSVTDPYMLATILSAIDDHDVDPANIVCEITETALVRDLDSAELFVRGLNEIGCKVALDDFGAGYGGFSYLKRLPVAYVKIDREFVRDLRDEMPSQHVVSAVVNLAKAFGMRTVAEGAEDDATLRLLKELGVDYVQGYVVGRPAPATEMLPAH